MNETKKLDEEEKVRGICLHCCLKEALATWGELEAEVTGLPVEGDEATSEYIMASVCRFAVDLMLGPEGKEDFDGFGRAFERTVKTLVHYYNLRAPVGRKMKTFVENESPALPPRRRVH
jgi:hypothetical protein